MYKLIAIDLDGTLLNDEKYIPEENIDIINKLCNSGYEVVFATGRRYLAAREFIDCFKQDLVIVANNGNMVRHTKDDQLIFASYLDNSLLEFVLEQGKKIDIHPTIHVNKFEDGIDMVFELEQNDHRYHNYLENETRVEKLENFLNEDLKILSIVYLGNYDKLRKLYDKINLDCPKDYQMYLMQNIFLAEALLEVVKPNSGKWDSVKNYAETKGIKPEEILAIGDDANDIEMIKNAGLGIAMNNAVEGVKIVADIITKYDNNNCGVSKVLTEVLSL